MGLSFKQVPACDVSFRFFSGPLRLLCMLHAAPEILLLCNPCAQAVTNTHTCLIEFSVSTMLAQAGEAPFEIDQCCSCTYQ